MSRIRVHLGCGVSELAGGGVGRIGVHRGEEYIVLLLFGRLLQGRAALNGIGVHHGRCLRGGGKDQGYGIRVHLCVGVSELGGGIRVHHERCFRGGGKYQVSGIRVHLAGGLSELGGGGVGQ